MKSKYLKGQLTIFDYSDSLKKELNFEEIKKRVGRTVLMKNQKGEKIEVKIDSIIPPDKDYSSNRILYIYGCTAVCIGEDNLGDIIHFFELKDILRK